jgi:oligosaccharide repeat unit polymerase
LLAKISPFISLFLLSLPVVFLLDKGIKDIALFFLFSNPGAELETMTLRIGGLTSNYSPVLTALYSYSRTLFYPTYVAILIGLRANKLVSRAHVLFVLAAAMLFSTFSAEKAPLAYLMATAGFSMYLSNQRRIDGQLVLTWLLAILLPAMIYPLLYGSQGISFLAVAISGLWRRLTWVPSFTSALYFDLFPRVFDQLGFRSNRVLASIFGMEYVPVASMVYNYRYTTIQGGLVNTSFFASFYADWGMPGVILGTMLVALIIAVLQRLFDRYNIDAVNVGIRAKVLSSVVQLMLTNFYSVALGRGLLSLPILLVLLNLVGERENVNDAPQPSKEAM